MRPTGTIAITGAGSGLGMGVALECLRAGDSVLALVLESEQRAALHEAAAGLPGTLTVEVLDVTELGDFAFPDDLEVLVNNAAIRTKSLPIEEVPSEVWRRYMEVNFFGAVGLTQRAIPHMRRRGRGVICNINSITTAMPFPFLAPYRATKGAMAAFSESLKVEVAPFGIRVIEIMPGAIRTGMNPSSIVNKVADAVDYEAYRPMAERQRRNYLESNTETVILEIEDAAKRVVNAILDDGKRMRYGVDQLSDDMIEAWRPGGGSPIIDKIIDDLLTEAGQ